MSRIRLILEDEEGNPLSEAEVFARVVDRLPITRRPSPVRFLLPILHF